jgi:hypothetical protein
VTTGALAGVVPVGAAVAGAAVATGPLTVGAGAAMGAETGDVVTGVTTSFAVTDPLTSFFRILARVGVGWSLS